MHQIVPRSGPKREALREKGQFWTPDWVAEAMVAYALQDGASLLFDPSVGAGAFFLAAKRLGSERGYMPALAGTEVDVQALRQANGVGLSSDDLDHVQITDFLSYHPPDLLPAIVGNPPYIRHHRLSAATKTQLKHLSKRVIGKPLDGRAGFHVYFLIHALQLLKPQGRLALIVPADICEGLFSADLWRWISRNYALDAVVTFAPDASPFPDVDTNPIILMIRNALPEGELWWAKCLNANTTDLRNWVMSDFQQPSKSLQVCRRQLAEAIATGLSRAPKAEANISEFTLGDFARVMRGIATGANDYFFLTRSQADLLEIPDMFLIPAIGRTRDVPDDCLTGETFERLAISGRPTLLFSPDGRALEEFPESVQAYIRLGYTLGLPEKPLISQRRPWYRMEIRSIPPLLFAYLGRRNARFILNEVGVTPLTGFLCVYPHEPDRTHVEKLWRILNHPLTLEGLPFVGKSYGTGAIKVEPRNLEKLAISSQLVREYGLIPLPTQSQMPLL